MMGFEGLNMSSKISPAVITVPRIGKREVGVLSLIEWAFQREHASLDFDEIASENGARPGVDTIWHLMEGKRLGCRVDGGGRSDPHHDADIVASALAVLPDVYGVADCRTGPRRATPQLDGWCQAQMCSARVETKSAWLALGY